MAEAKPNTAIVGASENAGDVAVAFSLQILGVLCSLYLFLFGLDLMGGSFVALFSKHAANLFTFSDFPIAGLMVGILVTFLMQSSSTTTSIVVALVGADVVSVQQAIPIIMGANIGTTVTNTIVSMVHSSKRIELERAFAGATVHDMFNILSVITLLSLEIVIGGLTGEGGLLFYLSKTLTEAALRGGESDLTFDSPIKEMVGPFTKLFLNKDKNTIKALSFGAPQAESCGNDCSRYCVSSSMTKAWKKVAKDAYQTTLTKCEGSAGSATCESGSCYTNADEFFKQNIETARTIKGGFLKDAGDLAGGIIGLVLSLLVMCCALLCMVKLLHLMMGRGIHGRLGCARMTQGRCRKIISSMSQKDDVFAMLLGLVFTVVAQSSSTTTSVVTPLVGIGVVPVYKMLPITLGANLGTTVMPLVGALATRKSSSLQIAFCHFLFNFIGIVIWYPMPMMRRIVLRAACTLGVYAWYWRLAPLIYILLLFVAMPGLCLLVGLLFSASPLGGIVVTIAMIDAVVAFIYWWINGGYKLVLSEEQREAQRAEMEEEMGPLKAEHAEHETPMGGPGGPGNSTV